MTLRWKKVGTDDYKTICGRFSIVRFPADMNRYTHKDEWTLCEHGEAVDIFPLLRQAKDHAEKISANS